MPVTIVRPFQLPFIVTQNMVIYGYWPPYYQFTSNIEYFEQNRVQNEEI